VLDENEDYLNNIQSSFEIDDNESEEAVRYKTLKLDQVKLNISSIGMKKELIEGKKIPGCFLFPKCYLPYRRFADCIKIQW
jgi:hypothetical protein